MAYVVLFFKDQEIGRRKLDRPLVIGRSPECDLSIRDVLLSRRHCRIDPEGREWVISDLGSKNGTRIGGVAVARQGLRDADVIRIGRSTVRFYAGKFVPASKPAVVPPALQRPADPFEALSGTVTAFEFQPRGPVRKTGQLPTPRPGPPEPDSYAREDIRGMVKGLVSSSWDSIYEHAKRPDPVIPQSPIVENLRRLRPREPHVDLSLQVQHEEPGGAPRGKPAGQTRTDPSTRHRPHPFRSLLRFVGALFH